MKIISRETLSKTQEKASFAPGLKLTDHMRVVKGESSEGRTVVEFIGNSDFPQAFNERRQYELDAGRDEEPTLYEPIYNIIDDPTLPEFVPVFKMGPAGVVLEQVYEGGEVRFATVSSSQQSVQILHYGVGIEYTKDLVIFNRIWQLGLVERQTGIAYNALRNHVHLYPIINATYPAANLTAASAVGSDLMDKMLRTIEDGMVAGENDATTANRRGGPYVLLCSTADRFRLERAFNRVGQQGIERQSSAIDLIQGIVAYNGWSGTRGKKVTTYTGCTSGTAFLISLNNRALDFQSFVKQGLESEQGNPDISRFILEQTVWDTYLGVYANPVGSVQKISLPTS